MNTTAQVLSQLILKYIDNRPRNYTLIVPGLTAALAEEIHSKLLEAGKNSFLVINEQRQPSEAKRWISPVNLTTMRIGSFVVITDIGALSEIRDSIQGTGGVIRSRAFSEEWPWIDEGPDWAKFRGPFIDLLLARWVDDNKIQQWLSDLIVDEILAATKSIQNRELVLLEEIIGTFAPSSYPAIDGIANKFLFHCGIPLSEGPLQEPRTIAQNQHKLLAHIRGRLAKEANLREQVLEKVDQADPDCTNLRAALNTFFDGLHRPDTFPKSLLAFKDCWGIEPLAIDNWLLLTSKRLSELFDKPDKEKITLEAMFLDKPGVVISKNKTQAACRLSDPPTLEITCDIPPNEFKPDSTRVQVSNNKQVLFKDFLTTPSYKRTIPLPLENLNATYKAKITLRVEIFLHNSPAAKTLLHLHCCGENRPAFVVTAPDFQVDDAKQRLEDKEAITKAHTTEGPIQLYFFSANNSKPIVETNDTDSQLPLTASDGYWYSQNPIDVLAQPNGRFLCRCEFDDHFIDLSFESDETGSGEFTLEDELRTSIANANIPRVHEILELHVEGVRDTYARLGNFTTETQRLSSLAKLFEQQQGHKVILANLSTGYDSAIVECGPHARMTSDTPRHNTIKSVQLPENALAFLHKYGEEREAVRSCVTHDKDPDRKASKYPDYALLPLYVESAADTQSQVEIALTKYLTAYCELQKYLLDHFKQLNWGQLFVLTHLDTVVHWGDGQDGVTGFLIGPWHPLVLAKRLMVQRALALRGKRLLKSDPSCKLVELLARIPGFHWHSCLRDDEPKFEVAYVSPTSDPGWHCAITRKLGGTPESLSIFLGALQNHYGLQTTINLPPARGMIDATVRGYLRTFPSKRHLGIYFPTGFSGTQEIETADRLLHERESEEQGSPTTEGLQLLGGINLSFQSNPIVPPDTIWSNPSLKVFKYEEFDACLKAQHPDIRFHLPTKDIQFSELELTEVISVPRGANYGAVFSQALSRITLGQDYVPRSMVQEWDTLPAAGTHLSDRFREACTNACRFNQTALGLKQIVDLPTDLSTTWSVIPGTVIDPRVFVNYVTSDDNPRALWDYRINLFAGASSFFVLSKIPNTFNTAVNSIFGHSEKLAYEFVRELSQIGLAIAGEAMKSGRNALGTVSFVGAARLFAPTTTKELAIPPGNAFIAFLLPVDSFQDFFPPRNEGSPTAVETNSRADLLFIKLKRPTSENSNIIIESTAIECKYTTEIYNEANAAAALSQAQATETSLSNLCNLAKHEDGIPERLALLRLIRFGLRISNYNTGNLQDEDKFEGVVYEKLLRGEFDYISPTVPFVLVTTEAKSDEAASWNRQDTGVWIRLNPRNWPGIAETESINAIKRQISDVFGVAPVSDVSSPNLQPTDTQTPVLQPTPTDATPNDQTQVVLNPTPNTSASQAPTDPKTRAVPSNQQDQVAITPPAPLHPTNTAEVPQETGPSHGVTLTKVRIGTDVKRRAIYFDPHSPLTPLDNAHMMITGSSGKGKTQLLKYLITELCAQGTNTFVADFKNDFASDQPFLAQAKIKPIEVILEGFPFNPLIPFPILDSKKQKLYLSCGQHIIGISSVFKHTYRLGPQQEAALRNAIREAFREYGIDYQEAIPFSPTLEFPDFATVGVRLQQSNPKAYDRLAPLFTLGLFKSDNRRRSFDTMLNTSVAINLSSIQSDDLKNALVELMILSAHSYYNAQPHVGTIRQAIVVDEAHRILYAQFLPRFSRECRAFGVSLIMSSQYPTDFPVDISASMATKIIHGNDKDKGKVRNIIDLLALTGQEDTVGGLKMFEAFFSNEHHPSTKVRTIAYPHALVLTALRDRGPLTLKQITELTGLDTGKLTAANIINHLQQLELCRETNGTVQLIAN